ncbi:stage V sporulation protein AA [Oceanobacillus luteolus]|uniref:Stage V sporulation protein AA n=1 Tax=Oceanobacillus luteolus TaxID=1274358 RepID=A0ABW4HTU3_9BACI|nr:stage V sporulation protein AA [Oceanobacillus luteolus]
MTKTLYLRMKRNLNLQEYKHLHLKDIAYIAAPEELQSILENKPIYRMSKKDNNIIVIDSFLIIKELMAEYKELDVQSVGPAQTVIRIETKKKKANLFIAVVIWILLFIGTAMTIMNFHYDVSMQEVQQKLHYILTGVENEFPLWIQVPYSLGLGIGTLLFFNHWFNKRFNEEPSPLEVEIENYQADVDQYLILHENRIDERS